MTLKDRGTPGKRRVWLTKNGNVRTDHSVPADAAEGEFASNSKPLPAANSTPKKSTSGNAATKE
jgi:hypothetical protein